MIRVMVDLLCETPGCSAWFRGPERFGHSPEVKPAEVRTLGAQAGWTTVRLASGHQADRCPECSRKALAG